MSAHSLPPPVSPPPSAGRFVRVEYLNFQSVAEHREFRLRVTGPEGSYEVRLRIPMAAFGPGRLRLQDGPDVCYQKLLRAVAAGETASADVITIDDVELARYREAHVQVQKHRSWTSPPPPTPALAPLGMNDTAPALQEGAGVTGAPLEGDPTTSSTGDPSVDEDEDPAAR